MSPEQAQEAADAGEIIAVRYAGGSMPGVVRPVAPVNVSGDSVWCRCYWTGKVKRFKLAKLEQVDFDELGDWVAPAKMDLPQAGEPDVLLNALLEMNRDAWAQVGWRPRLSGECLELRRSTERPVKLALEYDPSIGETVVDDEGHFTFEVREASHCWVFAADSRRIRFKHFPAAARRLMEMAGGTN